MKEILVIEDEVIIQLFMEQTLVRAGYSVDCCDSPSEVLKIADFNRYQAIFCDIGLGDRETDGIDLFIRIRETCERPFIFVTGSSDIGTMRRLHNVQHPYRLLRKPVVEADILQALGEFDLA